MVRSLRRVFIFSLLFAVISTSAVLASSVSAQSTTLSAPMLNPQSIDGGTDAKSATPTFSWSSVVGAVTYNIELCKVAFTPGNVCPTASKVQSATGIAKTSWTPTKALPSNITIYWRVQAAAPGYAVGPWSNIASFLSANAPPAPAVVSPTATTVQTATSVTLGWKTTVTATGVKPGSYGIQIAKDTAFTTIIHDTTMTRSDNAGSTAVLLNDSYTVPSNVLANGTQYFWRVRGIANNDASAWTPVTTATALGSFKTKIGVAVNSSPTNGSSTEEGTPLFSWASAGDGVASYTLQYTLSGNPSGTYVALSTALPANTTSHRPTTALGKPTTGTVVYWRVLTTPLAGFGTAIASAPTSLTPAIVPPAPALTAPVATAVQKFSPAPVLSWKTTVTSAGIKPDSYNVQVSTDPKFGSTVVNTTVNEANALPALTWTNNYTVPTSALTAGTQYYWRVRGRTAGDTTAWVPASNTATTLGAFKMEGGVAENLSPSNGSSTEEGTPLFRWNSAGANIASYAIQISTNGGTSYVSIAPAVNGSTFEVRPTAALAKPTVGTALYWRVLATPITGYGTAKTSAPFTLTPAIVPPLPVMTLPAATSAQTLTPTLTWKTTVTATGIKPDSYNVQVSTDPKFGSTVVNATVTQANMLPSLIWTNSYAVPSGSLTSGTQYYWRVRGRTAGDTTAWVPATNTATTLGAFKTQAGTASNVSPANGSSTEEGTPLFRWNSAGANIASYSVQVSVNGGGTYANILPAVAGNVYEVRPTSALPKPTTGTVLYWRVNATPATGYGTAKASAPFTLTPAIVPPLPVVVGPAPTTTQKISPAPILTWKTTVTAAGIKPDSFDVQVSTDPKFSSTVVSTSIQQASLLPALTWNSSYTVPGSVLSPGTQYYWRVRGKTSGDATAWVPASNTATTLGAFKVGFEAPVNTDKTLEAVLSASPSPGLIDQNIQLTTTVSGTATGAIVYEYRCDSALAYQIGSGSTFTCVYSTAGIKNPGVRVTRDGISTSADASSVVITAPTPSPTPAPTPTPTPPVGPGSGPGTAGPRTLNVLEVRYFPISSTLTEQRAKTNERSTYLIGAMKNASKPKGYKNASANNFLNINKVATIERLTPSPNTGGVYGSLNAILTANNNQICNSIATNKIDQVWVWFDVPGDNHPGDSGGYNNEFDWIFSRDLMPNQTTFYCGGNNTFLFLGLDQNADPSNAFHSFGHSLENILPQIQGGDLFWSRWVGKSNLNNYYSTTDTCGDVHFPPNGGIGGGLGYDYGNTGSVSTRCENWKPDGTGSATTVSCSRWGCSQGGFLEWWIQNMPSAGNGLTYQNKKVPNWLDFLVQTDESIKYYSRRSYEWWMAPEFIVQLSPSYQTPDYIDNQTVKKQGTNAGILWEHKSSGTNRLLTVAIAYGSDAGNPPAGKVNRVTCNGTDLTLLRGDWHNKNTEIWYRVGQPETCNLSVTFSGTVYPDTIASAISFDGVNQTSPFTANTGSGNDNSGAGQYNKSLSVGSAVGDISLVAYASYTDGNSTTAQGNTTAMLSDYIGGTLMFIGAQKATSATTNLQWKVTNDWFWAASAFTINKL